MNIIVTSGGITFNDVSEMFNHTTPLHTGFIISATASMIEDNPEKEKIEQDLSRLKFSTDSSGISIPDTLIRKTLTRNMSRILEYGNIKKIGTLVGYKKNKLVINITKSVKTGALLKNEHIENVQLLSLSNPHPVIYSRDFIGYFFEFSVNGSISLIFNNNSEQAAKISLSRIPVLAFKSENSLNNESSLKLSKEIFYRIIGRKIEIVL